MQSKKNAQNLSTVSAHSSLTISQSSASISRGEQPEGAGRVEITPALNDKIEYLWNKEKNT